MEPLWNSFFTSCIFSLILVTLLLLDKDKDGEDAMRHWLSVDCDADPSGANAGAVDCAAVFLAPVGFSLCISAAQGATRRGLKGRIIVTWVSSSAVDGVAWSEKISTSGWFAEVFWNCSQLPVVPEVVDKSACAAASEDDVHGVTLAGR